MFKISFDRFSSAIYVLYKNGEIYYIGKSVNVFGRIGQHEKTFDMDFDRVDVYPCDDFRLQDIEKKLIELYQPPRNSQLTRGDLAKIPLSAKIAKLEKEYESKFVGEINTDNIVSWLIREDKRADEEYSAETMKCKGCIHADVDIYRGLPHCDCDLGYDERLECWNNNRCYYQERERKK